MIKFNNFPPEKVGDVELTEAAAHELTRLSINYVAQGNSTTKGLIAHGMGQSVGHTIFSAAQDKSPEFLRELVEPVGEAAVETTRSQYYHSVGTQSTAGIRYGLQQARKMEFAQ